MSIDLPFTKEREQPPVRTLYVTGLAKTEWANYNGEAKTKILTQMKAVNDAVSRGDVLRLYQRPMGIINITLSSRFTRGARGWRVKKQGPLEGTRGFEGTRNKESRGRGARGFVSNNASHPKIKQLQRARHTVDHGAFMGLAKKIKSDGRSAFLNKTRTSDMTKLSHTLATMDGHKRRGTSFSRPAPLEQDGELFATGEAKCGLLADYFQKKLNGPLAQEELKSILEEIEISFDKSQQNWAPVEIVEVVKATNSLSPQKAPGPDKIPVDVYLQLPALLPLMSELFAQMGNTSPSNVVALCHTSR